MKGLVVGVLIFCLFAQIYCQDEDEILLNPGFEDPFDENWYPVAGRLTQSTDAYAGIYSAEITNREEQWSSISQNVSLESNTNYYFTAYIKLTEMLAGALWHEALLQVELTSENGTQEYIIASRMPYLRQDQGWQKLGGDFYTGSTEVESFRVFIQVTTNGEPLSSYLVDEASLKPFYLSPNWKEEADARIEEIRKNNVQLNVNVIGDYDPTELEIEVNQVSQSYPFGSAVQDAQISGDSDYNKRYQDTFYSNFNWAVLENALKWTYMEEEREIINFPDESISRLNASGVPVRGHAVFWGKIWFVPDWILLAPPEEIESEVQRRIDYVVSRYAGQLVHWDINNEQEHGSWFERNLENPTYMNNMFTDVRRRDENVQLFLNDYQTVSGNIHTQSYISKALEVQEATGLVGGLGLQSHIQGARSEADLAGILKRLELLTATGISAWVTELDVEVEDREERADAYDDVVTLYYSYPGVDGILLWGFSDNHHWRPNCALFEGDDFTANAAGLRWQEMIFQRWRTYEKFYPQSSEESFGFRGFHGLYTIDVYNNGDLIQSENFEIPTGQDTVVDLEIN